MQPTLTRLITMCGLSTAVLAAVASGPAAAATLTVGPGRAYATIASAVAASQDGDVLQVQAGDYVNDFATVTKKIKIIGVGGMARLVATVPPPNGKAILTTTTDVTLKYLELTGARVADLNGAGVRYEGGALIVRRCYFHDNENGIMGGSWAGGTVVVESSEFARNGRGDGYTHGVYLGKIDSLRVSWSWLHDTRVGHHVKSRAQETIVNGNRVVDGADPTASYSVDLPNGGDARVYNNVIEQSATGSNSALISFATESAAYPGSALRVTNNTLQNFRFPAIGVLNNSPVVVSVTNNRLHQLPNLVSGPSFQSGNTVLTTPVTIATTSPWRG